MISAEIVPYRAMFRIADVAALFGVPRVRVYSWIKYGNMKAWKVDRCIRVPREFIIEYIENDGKQVNKSSYAIKNRIVSSLRGNISRIIKYGFKKSEKSKKLLGCSFEEFMEYIEKQFKPGISWDNYGRGGWHVDHIIPVAQFDLSRPYHQRICFHYTNLQPMWEKDNIRKGKKISRIDVAKFFINFRKSS